MLELRCIARRAGSPGFRRAVSCCLALLLAVLPGCGGNDPGSGKRETETTKPQPSSTVGPAARTAPSKPDIDLVNAEAVSKLLASAKGKVLVVNVWATYCIPCMEEMPELATFYRERDAKTVEFLSLSADFPYSVDDVVKPFVAEKDLPFAVHVLNVPPDDLIGLLGAKDAKWGGELPATFVFDATGALRKFWLERVHLQDLRAAVQEVAAS